MPLAASIQTFIDRQADAAPERYADLRAVIFNGTLKRSPEPSQTDGLLGDPARDLRPASAFAWTRSARSTTRSRRACGRT